MKKLSAVLIIITAVLSSTGSLFAQGEAAAEFLLIAPGARPGGMGETNVAIADDATATYWNPAGLGFLTNKEISIMHTNWLPEFNLPDLYYDFGSYVHPIEGWGTVGIHAIYLSLGENIRTDEEGNEIGTFSSYQMAFGASYGTKMSDNLSLGVTMKYIYLKLADRGTGAEKGSGSGSSVAVDVGVLYKFSGIPKLTFGANLSNMGPKIAFIDEDQADPIPTNLKFGFAYKLIETEFNKLTLSFDANKLLVVKKREGDEDVSDPFYKAIFTAWTADGADVLIKKMSGAIGAEYWYNNLIALRSGYFYEHYGKRRFLTLGAGIRYSMYGFDFGYINATEEGHPLSNTMRFSLSFKF